MICVLPFNWLKAALGGLVEIGGDHCKMQRSLTSLAMTACLWGDKGNDCLHSQLAGLGGLC
jgi:hypothetical protein